MADSAAAASTAGLADSTAGLAAVLRPVRRGNAFEETVERLLTVIRLGLLAPGERFPAERELAGQLGVSRITLRDAIGELARAGFVESRRGRFGGTFVTGVPATDAAQARQLARQDASQLADALAYRLAVEAGAAQAAARLMAAGGQAADRITAMLPPRLAELNAAGPGDYRRLDTRFHLAIGELTGSGLLAAACADARLRLNDLLAAIPVLQRNIDHTARQHTAIAEAILAGQPDRARRAMTAHLDGTAALLRGFLA